MPPRPQLTLPVPGARRAVVLGAGSFGTAVAVLLARGGFRTTLQTRSTEQAEALESAREHAAYPAAPLDEEGRDPRSRTEDRRVPAGGGAAALAARRADVGRPLARGLRLPR